SLEHEPDTLDLQFATATETTFVDEIDDDELRMLFVCADDSLNERTRLILCLKLLSGFSTQEIAARLVLTESDVQKMLERGRKRLKERWSDPATQDSRARSVPKQGHLTKRLSSVQRVSYLQFNEGYSSLREEEPLRPELCFDALRLGELLVSQSAGDTGSSWALLALMHFHAARLSTRLDGLGQLLLLE